MTSLHDPFFFQHEMPVHEICRECGRRLEQLRAGSSTGGKRVDGVFCSERCAELYCKKERHWTQAEASWVPDQTAREAYWKRLVDAFLPAWANAQRTEGYSVKCAADDKLEELVNRWQGAKLGREMEND